ncbi:MAG: poly-beta-1,6 N-acetyl-D-glucosamine synthase [bacterium]|nr:poly-beta-1,6 N-acetyl-D-glucosamine synthase [bacterium]
MHSITAVLLDFVYYYPLFMAYLWMMGAIYYYYHWESKESLSPADVPKLRSYPKVSIIVPCYNEGDNARETISYLFKQDYPNYEVIAVNDGSKDNTGEILDELMEDYPKLRVIHLARNSGKAMGLRMGFLASRSEYLICIDGDAVLDPHVTSWMMFHFLSSPRVAAITGNPRVRTRSSLLGKIQVGEFSAIIGLMKRAQRIYGRIFTVSGVVVGFRKTALHQVGLWSIDMVTEDIDISWKLQLNHWDVRYEPNALCWILMPETLKGLWNQRLRWSQGGFEVLFKYLKMSFAWKKRRMWPIMLEYGVSIIWSYLMALIIILWLLGKVITLPSYLYISTMIPGWNGVVLAITCLLQFAVSMAIDSRYEEGLGKFYFWLIWYPLLYWLINVSTIVVAVPKALMKRKGSRATWTSPDRGMKIT